MQEELETALNKVDKYFFVSPIGLNITEKDFKNLQENRFPNLTTRMFKQGLVEISEWISEKSPNMEKSKMYFVALNHLDKLNKKVGQ